MLRRLAHSSDALDAVLMLPLGLICVVPRQNTFIKSYSYLELTTTCLPNEARMDISVLWATLGHFLSRQTQAHNSNQIFFIQRNNN